MSGTDPFRKLNEGPVVPAPPRTEGTKAEVTVKSQDARSKVTVTSGEGAPKGSWPRDEEEWKRLARAVLPWVAGAAIIVAASSAVKKSQEPETTGEYARRKARRAGDAVEDAKDNVRHGWFGFKRRAADAADDVGRRAESTKEAADRKAREAKDATKGAAREVAGFAKDRAHDAKEGAREAGWWVSDKAHDVVDATKSAAHKVEHGAAAAGSAALATAAAGEERTGHAMKEAGKKLEADGAQAKRHYRGEQVKEDTKKKFGVCSIM